jgi:hypothetical protein
VADYDKLLATARRLIEENGRTLTLRKPSTTPQDATKPWRGPASGSETSEDVTGVVVGLALTEETRDLIQRGYKQALVAPPETETDLKGYKTLVDGEEVWHVESVQVVKPGDVALLYKFTIRK